MNAAENTVTSQFIALPSDRVNLSHEGPTPTKPGFWTVLDLP